MKILDNSIEIPTLSTDAASASTGYSRLFSKDSKIYIRQSTGDSQALAVEAVFESSNEVNPVYTYTSGDLTRIDYDSGNYKLFTYTSGNLTRVDYVKGLVTYRKDFSYDLSSNLTQITYSSF